VADRLGHLGVDIGKGAVEEIGHFVKGSFMGGGPYQLDPLWLKHRGSLLTPVLEL
jgi:hypothetical protein